MTTLAPGHASWRELLEGALPPVDTTPLGALRGLAAEAFSQLPLPSGRDEAWRFTSLAPLLAERYEALPTAGAVLLPQVSRLLVPEAEGRRLTFVDGVLAPELSATGALPAGVELCSLGELDASRAARLGGVVRQDESAFTACAARLMHDGAWLHVPAGVVLEEPLQLLFVSSGSGAVRVTTPRVHVSLGRGASATLVQMYAAAAEEIAGFTNVVTEVALEAGARLTHVRVQSESRRAVHVETLGARLAQDACYALGSVTLGARLSRLDVRVEGTGTGMDATLDGLALLAGDQVADTHTALVHHQPHGRSRQAHRMILDGQAHAVFSGLIKVAPGAIQTDSAQSSRGLLLSAKARIDTKPELAIEADDVKCAHGAAVGQLDPEQLFYLRARGLDAPAAEALLTYAFAAEALASVPVPSLRRQLQGVLLGRTTARTVAP
ncbi:MAG: Fe-S cluster assembly protein SufD [Candidatus Sericytochromatia bacterium]|nr:Fe-S cluster assembly protein SufD [Candidatus Sericytochromatia bacterium]